MSHRLTRDEWARILRNEIPAPEGLQLVCDRCKRAFSRKADLARHLRHQIECEVSGCDESFREDKLLNYHKHHQRSHVLNGRLQFTEAGQEKYFNEMASAYKKDISFDYCLNATTHDEPFAERSTSTAASDNVLVPGLPYASSTTTQEEYEHQCDIRATADVLAEYLQDDPESLAASSEDNGQQYIFDAPPHDDAVRQSDSTFDGNVEGSCDESWTTLSDAERKAKLRGRINARKVDHYDLDQDNAVHLGSLHESNPDVAYHYACILSNNKRMQDLVEEINALETELQQLPDDSVF